MPDGQQASSEAYQKGQKQSIPEGQKAGNRVYQKAWSRPESRIANRGRKDHVDRKVHVTATD